MFKHMTKKIVAGVLSALLLSQAFALPGFAVETPVENAAPVVAAETAQKPQLQNGTAVIPAGSTKDEVEEILNKTLIANYGEVNTQDLDWEYYCTGKSGLLTNDAWGSVGGFESEKKIVFVTTTFTHPALADNSDGDYQVRLEGTDTAVTLTKAAKLSSSITLQEGCTVKLPYNEDMSVNYDELRRLIFENVVESTTPEGLTPDDVTIEYYATATSGAVGDLGKAWMPLEGGKNGLLTYPAISAGEQKIRISYAGTDTIYGTSAEMDVTIAERPEAEIELNQGCTVKLPYTEEITVDYSALRELKEELGVDAEAGELECCGVRRIHWEDRFYGKPFLDNQVSRVYVLWKNLEISQFCPQTSEIEAVRWMDLETLFEQVERNSIPHCIFTEELCMVKRKLEEESAFPVLPAEEEDLEAILSLERIAFERLSGGQKDWYVTDDMGFLRRHLKAEGTLLKIPCGRRLAAFLALRFPKDAADSLFPYAVQYAGAAKGDERLCAHMETVAVHPDFYGNGLMKKLLEEGISLAEREGMRYLLATVHPDNRFSRGNFEKAGFRPLTETRKYGGLRRLIYYYECSGS